MRFKGFKLFVRACLVGFLLSTASFAPTALADTLADALTRAVANLPEVRAARANQRASVEAAAQARSAWYPSVDASVGRGRETSNNPSTRILGSDQTLTRREAELSLSQLVFDGGATSGQVRRFQSRADGAADQLASAAENAGARVAQAYLDVIRLRELLTIAAGNEKRHQETLAQVTRLADVGQGRRADAQQADARYALAQASLTQLRGQLAQAEAAFLHLTGLPPGQLADAGNFRAALPATLADALALALETHPAIRAAQKDLLAAQADRDSLRSRYASPRLALEVGTSANHDLDGLRGANTDRYAMLRLRYNLFRGGADTARVREAAARIDEASAGYGKARNDVERDLRQAWQTLAEDRLRLPQLQRYAAASAQVVHAYRLQFSIGQRTLLDVLNAENELFAARSSEYTGAYAVTLGELRVLAAMGRLLEALGVGIDAKPRTQFAMQKDATPAIEHDAPTKSAAEQNVKASALPPNLRMNMDLGSAEAGK
ncbi:MAG: TolC family outer membrane protein [Burkholderiales bacterium]|nr:TolC family outer membrane protein [Burkholderiales bacterium]